ncbi:protein involved in gliding motility SprE [Flavobacteriaceae bacterium MAR_2010_72]|nr:protein involved in gliding motility SprE [Flavobacteriaceae bacterium MAR_2010_72]
MTASFRTILLVCFTSLLVVGCSRKKDKFLNRNFHALGTKYNILYNGNIALEQGRESVDDAYTDNYWDLLEVERMQVSDEIVLPGQSKNKDFEVAEEKAIKAVQKHGMNIAGKEKNPQIDEAYLLLGKARYFDQRFVPALEAFNYILYKYPASDKINQAKIWREKANIRLENNELAIKNLKRIIEREELSDQDLADASAMLASAYINVKAKDSALTQLAIAAEYTNENTQKARYNYIRGQLYNEFGHKDSANFAFDKVIDLHRKVPRAYYINAHLAKANNFDFEKGNKLEFQEYLTKMEENRENRPFLDKIYYQIAEYHKANGSDTIAERYYNKSLRTNSQDSYLRSLDYSTLGDMSFDRSEYKKAGAYYDSTMASLTLNSKPYRVIKRKRDNLEDVIYYEDVAQVNDSILYLVNLSEAERLDYFQAFTQDLKEKAEERQEKEEIAQRLNSGLATNNINTGNNDPRRGLTSAPGPQSFYFYNQTTVAFGRNEFIKIWGDRSLKDNWRLSNSNTSNTNQQVNAIVAGATEEELYDPEFYISKIPTEGKAIDSLIRDRNYAYYQLGVIYKEKFKELELAKNRLKTLLNNDPEERLILPTKYHLYQIYEGLGETEEANIAKNDIISNYPDSRYAELLLNPKSQLSKDQNSPESLYEKVYEQFLSQNYTSVIEQSDQYIKEFDGEFIVPKFEILKASARGRLYGFEAYKESINYIALNYPNAEEGKKAEEIIEVVIPVLEKKGFTDDASANNFNVIYQFDNNSNEDSDAFLKKLQEEIADIRYFELSATKDVYDKNTTFIVIHGFNNIGGAVGFADLLRERKSKIIKPYIAISSPNYETVQLHKNLDEYIKAQ